MRQNWKYVGYAIQCCGLVFFSLLCVLEYLKQKCGRYFNILEMLAIDFSDIKIFICHEWKKKKIIYGLGIS